MAPSTSKREQDKRLAQRMRHSPGPEPAESARRSRVERGGCWRTARRRKSPRLRPHRPQRPSLGAPLDQGSPPPGPPQPGLLHREAFSGPSSVALASPIIAESHPSGRSSFQPVSVIMDFWNPGLQTGLPFLFHLQNCKTYFNIFTGILLRTFNNRSKDVV